MNTVNDAEAKLAAAVAEINRATAAQQTKVLPEVQPFVELSQKLADSIVEAYHQQLTEIQNKVREAEAVAQSIRDAAQARANDIADFRARAEKFGQSVLDAHTAFSNKETSK